MMEDTNQRTVEHLEYLARVRFERGEDAEVVRLLREVLLICPDRLLTYDVLKKALYRLEAWDELIVVCRRTVDLGPNDHRQHRSLAYALYKRGDDTESIACFERAIALNATEAETFDLLGGVQQRQGEFRSAIVSYEAALRLDPRRYSALYNLGRCLARIGQTAKARECFQVVARRATGKLAEVAAAAAQNIQTLN